MAKKKNYLTSTTLVEAVKRTAMLPLHQNTFSEDDILDFATEEMTLQIVPTIMKHHQDYFLTDIDIPIVQTQNRYSIPENAVGDKLRDVSFVDASGNVCEMTRISIDQIYAYNYGFNVYPNAFYVEGNEIVLAPTRQSYSDGKLKISYYYRTAPLVLDEEAGEVKTVDFATGVITFNSLPEDFVTTEEYDLISISSPFKTMGTLTSFVRDSETQITVVDPTTIPLGLKKGDFITYKGCSNIPQIPSDLHLYLMYRTTARVLESMNDTEALKNVYTKIQQLETSTTILIESRVDSAPEKIVNRNNALRSGSYIRRRWRY